jgi:mRNA interferase RelE/StbE
VTYEIRISSPARRDLNKLPESVAAAVLDFIFGALAENPQRVGKALTNELSGRFSARRGQYRIIYRIDGGDVFVEVIHIAHRRDVYRPR